MTNDKNRTVQELNMTIFKTESPIKMHIKSESTGKGNNNSQESKKKLVLTTLF